MLNQAQDEKVSEQRRNSLQSMARNNTAQPTTNTIVLVTKALIPFIGVRKEPLAKCQELF